MGSLARNARAYINYGRWIADCPTGCKSAEQLEAHQSLFCCHECKAMAPVEWPPNPEELWEALADRPKGNRNWFPADHELALAFGAPHGQTPTQLREETREHQEAS